jgi:hypothetical protein
MTTLQIVFWLICVTCLLLNLWFGERDEQHGMWAITLGSVLSTAVAYWGGLDVMRVTPWFLLADFIVLISFLKIAFESRKYWPIWLGSLQIITIAVHALNLLLPNILPTAYAMLQGFWVYPMFFAVMMGTYGSRVAAKRKNVRQTSTKQEIK